MAENTNSPESILVDCETCGNQHVAWYSHDSQWGDHRVYEATCDQDLLADYYTEEAAR